MSLPDNVFSTAFKHQQLGFLMFLMLAIMVYLGSLAVAAQSLLVRTSLVWGHDLEGRFTVEIPFKAKDDAASKQAKSEKIVAALKKMEGAEFIEPVGRDEMARLLKPWIADGKLLDSLPLPYLIDLRLQTGTGYDAAKLEEILSAEVKGVQIHAHTGWMGSLLGFVRGLGGLAGVMLVLTILSIIAVVAIICRAAISAQHDTISLLHYMGASDGAIAKAFQDHVKRLAVPAGLIGFALAVATVLLLALMLGVMGGLSVVAPLSWFAVGGVMVLVPLAAAGLSVLTARLSVLSLLRRFS